jgi:hypothetical protein
MRYPDSVQALTEGYVAFDFASQQPHYHSPFWRTFRGLQTRASATGSGAVLWSNLFRCALAGESAFNSATTKQLAQITTLQQGLLASEITALAPTGVLFTTGPNYDPALLSQFPGAVLEKVKNYEVRQLCRVRHPGLPPRTFRTYHPNYLHYKKPKTWLKFLTLELMP